ncbi:MAG: hypothetical protein HYY04_08580 [Chloroflexi bacterium]|nr:hypothetical protein [Chloroflexota bacterium]
MASVTQSNVYAELGVRPVVNARGHNTFLGGSRLSPRVLVAMEEANRHFCSMAELQEKSGQAIAEILGCEAALVTPGAAAALALGTAACITGADGARIEQIPDLTGLKNAVLIQRRHRYKYDRCVTIVGPKLVEVGDTAGTSAEQLAAALGPLVANVLFPAHLDGVPGSVSLAEVVTLARRAGVPTLVDAAGQVYPLDRFTGWARTGADLVCFGAKYFGAPNSTGILCGRRDLVEAAAAQTFVSFETTPYRTFGRPLKVDRQEVIAVVVALREWMSMDHDARLRGYDQKVRVMAGYLEGLPRVSISVLPEYGPATRLRVELDSASSGKALGAVIEGLRTGDPSIWVSNDDRALLLSPATLSDGEEHVVGERLRRLLAG